MLELRTHDLQWALILLWSVEPIQALDPHCRFTDIVDTPLHRPAQTVGRIASVTWLGGLHRRYVAFSAKRSHFFSESFRETQWVRYSPSIVGSPLRLKRSVWRRGVRVT